MNTIKNIHLTLAFVLELFMLGAIAWWGYRQGQTPVSKYALAITLVLLASVLWGIFAAPKSKKRLPFAARLPFQLCMFLTAAFLLYATGETVTAFCFAGAACISTALAYVLKQ